VDVGGSPSYALIANGKVILTVATSSTRQVVALDQKSGSKLWGPVTVAEASNATYDSGRVFVGSSPASGPGAVVALDADNGNQLWTESLPGTSFAGTPVATRGQVFVTSGGFNGSAATTLTPFGLLLALDESTGAGLWSTAVQYGTSVPAVTASGVYVSYPCWTYDFAPANGGAIWNQSTTSCVGHLGGGTMPAVANGVVYSPDQLSGYGGDVLAAGTGASVSTYSASVPAAFTADMGYFLQSGSLQGVSLSSGSTAWSFVGDGQLVGAPIVVNQYVFVGSASGNLYALDGTTGSQVWQVTMASGGLVTSSSTQLSGLAAGDGLLVVPSGTAVVAYTLASSL
jgi:outer membrane protein assembly factor BamB